MSAKPPTPGIKRLEITMRNVLDGLEDAAIYTHYRSSPDIVEILSIEAPGRPHFEKQNVIPICVPLDTEHNTNIVDYLIHRELKKSA